MMKKNSQPNLSKNVLSNQLHIENVKTVRLQPLLLFSIVLPNGIDRIRDHLKSWTIKKEIIGKCFLKICIVSSECFVDEIGSVEFFLCSEEAELSVRARKWFD